MQQKKVFASDAHLIRAVGLFALTAAIINIIVGGGIFRLPASISAQLGPAAPVAFLVGAIAIFPIMFCFAGAGSRVASTGGAYSYAETAYGPFYGFVTGAMLWICNLASSAGVAVALSEQIAHVFPAVGTPVGRALFLLLVYGILLAMNAFGVKLGARAIVALATLKLTPLILLSVIGMFFVDWSQINLFAVPSWAVLGTTMVSVMFAYSGAETALTPSGEVKDPARDVPRATMAAISLVVLLYVSIQIVAQGVLGPALPQSTAPLAATAGAIWTPGFTLLLIAASISMFAFLMGNLLGCSRIVYALGRDGYLPSPVARITEKYRVPLVALFVHAGIAWILAAWPSGGFTFLVTVSGGANCLVYLFVAIAAWKLERLDHREHGEPFRLPGGAVLLPLLSVVFMVAILGTLPAAEWTAIALALAGLVIVYAVLRATRKA